jgi:hypothetical protein
MPSIDSFRGRRLLLCLFFILASLLPVEDLVDTRLELGDLGLQSLVLDSEPLLLTCNLGDLVQRFMRPRVYFWVMRAARCMRGSLIIAIMYCTSSSGRRVAL